MKLRGLLLTSAAFVSMLATPAFAQDPQTESEVVGLQEIVVTAQRQSQSLQKVPIAVTAVTSEDLARRQINTTMNLEAAVPNLAMPQNGVSVTPFLRGVGSAQSNPNDEPSVATYIDGVYIASPTGNIFSFNNAERIEVLKGPQGTLFGRNATGGVIQIVTRDPDLDKFVLDASLGAGNHGTMEGRGYVSAPLGSTAGIDLAVVYDSVDGYGRDINRNTRIFRKEQIGLRSKLLFALGDSTEIRFSGDYTNLNSTGSDYQLRQGVIGADGVTSYPGKRKTNTDFENTGNNEAYGGSLRIDQDLGFARLASISAYRKVTGLYKLDQDATPTPIVQATINQFARNYSQEVQLFSPTASNIDWTIGGYFFDAKYAYKPLRLAGAGAAPFAAIDLFGDQKTRSYSIYGQATVPVTSTTKITGGLRWTYERQKTNGYTSVGGTILPRNPNPLCSGSLFECKQSQSIKRATWRLAVDQELGPDTLGYISYNRGIKSGGFNMINAGTPGYEPETVDAYEIGLKTQFLDRRARLNIAGFYYDYKDIQVFSVVGGGVVLTENAASARVYGADADFAFQVTPNLTFGVGVGILDSKYEDFKNATFTPASPLQGPVTTGDASGNRTVYSPKFSSNANIDYRVPTSIGELSANLSVSQKSKVFVSGDNRLSIPGYAVVNAVLGWRAQSDQVGVQFWARNLLDKDYYSNRTEQGLGDIQYLAPPRTVGVTFSFKTL